MTDKVPAQYLWQIMFIDAWQYHAPDDDLYLRVELKNEADHTTCEVNLPWTGELIVIMNALEMEVRRRIRRYLDEVE